MRPPSRSWRWISPEAGRQATRCFEQILDYIGQLGGHSGDVVRVRMFVTDIKDAEAVTAAFTKAVGHARPTGTLVAVAEGERVIAGAAYFPMLDEIIVAAPGEGCWWNGSAAHVVMTPLVASRMIRHSALRR